MAKDDRKSEGSTCTCNGGPDGDEHARLIERVNASFKQDYDRESPRRKSAPTSETMRAKAKAITNGHRGAIKLS